jgi:hypothetical protein
MSPRQDILQHESGESQSSATVLDVSHRPFSVGEPLPLRMGISDMCRAFQISRSTFYRLQRIGKFDRFAIADDITGQAFSGEQVALHLRSVRPQQRTFGRKAR